MRQTTHFPQRLLPACLLLPQLVVTLVFFILPAFEALRQSFFVGDAFGLRQKFSGLANFRQLLADPSYQHSLWVTAVFSLAVALLALSSGLLLAVLVNRLNKTAGFYKTLLIAPYAVAPAVAGLLWRFLFNPAVGIIAYLLNKCGYAWDYTLNPHQALLLVIVAASWQQFSYNFLFFLAGLKAIPHELIEAAALDGAGPVRRFWTIVFPLLSPTSFFLLVINLIYAFFDTFGIIHIVTRGGPSGATNILVYKVYNDGFVGLDLGSSAAQSVLLMAVIILLTVIQFRYVERKVHY